MGISPHRNHGTATEGRRRLTRTGLVGVVATVSIVAGACGSSSKASNTTTPAAASTGTSGSAPTTGGSSPTGSGLAAIEAKVAQLEKAVTNVDVSVPPIKGLPDLKGKKLLIVPALGIVFNPSIGIITAALKPLGISVQECDGQGNPSTMASCMEQAPTIPDLAGVMTIGVPYAQTPTAYAALAKKNIPVAAVQQDPGGAKSVLGKLGFVGSTSVLDGGVTAAADYIIAKSDGKADVIALGDNSSPDVIAASQYMANYLKTNCPGCKVTLKEIASVQIGDATTYISAQMLQDPKVNYVLSINQDVSGEAVAKGLQSANATQKVKQGGPGAGLLSMQQVAQGSAGFVAAISGSLDSWNWADAMLRVIAKEPVPTDYPVVVRLFDTASIKQIKITPAEGSSFDWFGTANYPQQYYKLWAGK
jgi:ribose transport system substrate-binding protein